ncbi:MAG: gamma carbonic anhydrase family protein [Nitrospinae bacterium CG11_big_fil_rev_8_21_14_0_20_45_15]|nr:MAG: gamma carbonic anhydrase family protein [Nitrospinae bacterium CG11_big_fil_rev_8_21_14_0_20_45_15]
MIYPFKGKTPKIDASVFIADGAKIIGDVEIGEFSSIWFNAVVRGDVNYIRIGKRTNIQDCSVLHVTRRLHPLIVGDDITIGHNVTLHACVVKDRCLIGMGAVVMDAVEVGEDSIIGAGSLVTGGTIIPPRSMVLGSPAKVKRSLTDAEVLRIKKSAENYIEDILNYRNS